ncbi:Phosphatidate cytidylyltransferase [Macleaya cordata]|uniref:phytol kinase n=1 Tax=Macleaya cordata TaxID=56857 RepID=A0A200R9Q4_MACCD|nr:Phosphatidate cytidylyltransferase [Macleaya cordata]
MSLGASISLSFTPPLHTSVSIVRRPAMLLPLFPGFSRLRRTSTTNDNLICFRPSTSSSSKVQCASHLFDANQGGALLQDAGATALVMAGAYSLVLVFDNLTKREGFLFKVACDLEFEQKTGPCLVRVAIPIMLANLQNSTSEEARYFAAFVPLVNCVRLVINGLSLTTDEGLVKSVTREGNPKELLKGPLCYVLILILSAVIFWRDSPVGIMALAMMCGGDGIADIIGRRFGKLKIPYNQNKSWAGSISMFTFGFLISIGMLYYFSALGYFELDWSYMVGRVALVSLVATVVESLPTTEVLDDNISVPLSTMLVAVMFFG